MGETKLRNAICSACKYKSDGGTLLWTGLHLEYTEEERKRLYDLMLYCYFKLKDMTTDNVACIIGKIIRELNIKCDGNFQPIRDALIDYHISGNNIMDEIHNGTGLAKLFEMSMYNIRKWQWENVYNELIQWRVPVVVATNRKSNYNRLSFINDRDKLNNSYFFPS